MNAFNPYHYIGQDVMVDLNYRTDEQLKHLRREHGRTAHLRPSLAKAFLLDISVANVSPRPAVMAFVRFDDGRDGPVYTDSLSPFVEGGPQQPFDHEVVNKVFVKTPRARAPKPIVSVQNIEPIGSTSSSTTVQQRQYKAARELFGHDPTKSKD